MYKIRFIQKTGKESTEGFISKERALDRFNVLKAKKEKFGIYLSIYLEELIHSSGEYLVHRIG